MNYFHKKHRKEKIAPTQDPLNIRQMEKMLVPISYVAGLTGLSAASFSLTLWYCILLLISGSNSTALVITKEHALALAAVGAFLFFTQLFFKNIVTKIYPVSVQAYPNAAAYLNQSIHICRIKAAAAFLLCAAGYVVSICLPNYLIYNDLYMGLALCAATVAFSAFFAVSLLSEWQIYKKIRVICIEDSWDRDPFDIVAERKRVLLIWSIYWMAVLTGYLTLSAIFRNFSMYAFYFILAAAYFLLHMAINNPFRRYSSIRAKRITVIILNLSFTLVMAGLCLFAIEKGSDYNKNYIDSLDYARFEHNSSFTYDNKTGIYTISGNSEEFRILQLTDLHICGSITTLRTDRMAFRTCYDLILETQPDMIVITGDLVYPLPLQTFSKDNLGAMGQLCDFMNHIGIPWMFVYGNHDTETAASYQAKELTGLFNYYSQVSGGSMLYADKQPEIYGRYNQCIKVQNTDGSLNRLLFLIDSNDYVKDAEKVNEYDSVHEDQIQWYADTIDQISAEEGRIVPSFVFMHIPFQAFAQAQEALKNGSGDAEYLFGVNGEGVSCPEKDSGFFERILEKQSTQAVFVGHDHLNNMAVKYKGVDLVYSKSIDYYAYPGIADKAEQRGATLITLFQDGTYDMEQIDYEINKDTMQTLLHDPIINLIDIEYGRFLWADSSRE